eukprot:scaffold3589_cov48-Phaeocystis_antarctica.AAC.2
MWRSCLVRSPPGLHPERYLAPRGRGSSIRRGQGSFLRWGARTLGKRRAETRGAHPRQRAETLTPTLHANASPSPSPSPNPALALAPTQP